ncbi:uncharacterized protein LOC133194494 [Saccostrea echinata]|uniref:uncharacterized protein LOC133194494 n=1 Tax=Saccostrea echinata TaxID=191078 RepID=UPI002A8256E6|nr:uncharacterized protein LOC133194494 [Saccostrea echinata]
MRSLLIVYSLINLCKLSFEFPEKRQAGLIPNCGDQWSNVPNPCKNNHNNQLYYPHPHDKAKFLQCTADGEMYIIQCPQGKEYNPSVTSCAPPVTTTPAPVTVAFRNPCTASAIASGQIYFPYPNDNTKFMVCEGVDQVNIMVCPSPLIWDNTRQSCVYAAIIGQTPPPAATTVAPDSSLSTCQHMTVPPGGVYFSHPNPSKFIQCAPGGTAYVLTCPEGTVWNEFSKLCVSPFGNPTASPSF